MALALLILGALLCALGRSQFVQWQEASAQQQDWTVEALLALAATVTGLALLLWWTVAVLAAGAAVLLERLGRYRAAAAARRLSPAFMQRAVIAALSIQLMAGAAAHAGTTTPGPEWTPIHAHSSAALPTTATAGDATAPGHSGTPDSYGPGVPAPADTPTPTQAGFPTGRQTDATPPAITTFNPGWQPSSPVLEPGLLAAPDTRTDPEQSPVRHTAGGEAGAVTVLAGDTLWDIVAAWLGPEASDVEIAMEWPRWYAANRGLIGGSPDVLLPGQILQAPGP